MNEEITRQKLFDYFAGKATALEKKQIDEWSRDAAHREQFFDWLDEWEHAHLQYTSDQPTALDRYRNFLYADRPHPDYRPADSPVRPSGLFSRRSGLVWAIAASVAVVAVLLGFREQLITQTYTTAYGETRTLTLPDGSRVTLNANSSLRLPRFGFGNGRLDNTNRTVRLTGEALFSVQHTPTAQRFVVETDNGPEVIVLGTEFTVFARPRGTRIVLNRGQVEVHYQQPDNQLRQVTMQPGDLVTLSPKGEIRRQGQLRPSARPAWADHRFVFNETPLTEVAAMLSENYGLSIDIADPQTGRLTLSGAYPAQTPDELVRIIAEVLNIRLYRQADKFILTPNPAQ